MQLPESRKYVSQCAQWLTAWLGSCLLCLVSQTALAQSDDDAVINREYPLKALFIYNFGSYVEWPPAVVAGARQPFVIGILGPSRIESTLDEIAADKTINGRRLIVEHFDSAGAIKPCQILFVAREVTLTDQQLAVEQLRHEHVLIVGESRGFAQRGAVVNFFLEANKIRFEINLEAARQHNLKISAKLLALAKLVESTDAASREIPKRP